MNRKILIITGIVIAFAGIIITVLFDFQPYISATLTFIGLSIIFLTIANRFDKKDMENE